MAGTRPSFLHIFNNILNPTIKNPAQVIKCYGGNRLVVLQTVDKTSADAVFRYQGVGGEAFLMHCGVEGSVGNHNIILLGYFDDFIIIYALSLDNALYIEYNVKKK